jgi:hypothetical protein
MKLSVGMFDAEMHESVMGGGSSRHNGTIRGWLGIQGTSRKGKLADIGWHFIN